MQVGQVLIVVQIPLAHPVADLCVTKPGGGQVRSEGDLPEPGGGEGSGCLRLVLNAVFRFSSGLLVSSVFFVKITNILPLPKKAMKNTRFFRPEVALEGFLSSRIDKCDLWTKISGVIPTFFLHHPENQGA